MGEPWCSQGLHRPDETGREPNGECSACRRLRRRLSAAESRGEPLCWRGEHDRPDQGCICPCGEPPPPPTWIDWVVVEDALNNRDPYRPLTNAELCSVIRTAVVRFHQDNILPTYSPLTNPREWVNENTSVHLSENQYRYLVHEWLPKNGGVVPTAYEAFKQEVLDGGLTEPHP